MSTFSVSKAIFPCWAFIKSALLYPSSHSQARQMRQGYEPYDVFGQMLLSLWQLDYGLRGIVKRQWFRVVKYTSTPWVKATGLSNFKFLALYRCSMAKSTFIFCSGWSADSQSACIKVWWGDILGVIQDVLVLTKCYSITKPIFGRRITKPLQALFSWVEISPSLTWLRASATIDTVMTDFNFLGGGVGRWGLLSSKENLTHMEHRYVLLGRGASKIPFATISWTVIWANLREVSLKYLRFQPDVLPGTGCAAACFRHPHFWDIIYKQITHSVVMIMFTLGCIPGCVS